MSTLLMRLAAPIQSWGVDAKFDRRSTGRIPTKSGILGMIAAALGRRRNENIEDLLKLRFGVRIDKEGSLLRDFQTARSLKSAYVTHRYYLSDAIFLAGLEGDEKLLKKIEFALNNPEFPLFLGRRSCPPEGKVSLGIRTGKKLLDALREEPWLVSYWQGRKENSKMTLRIILDADDTDESYFFQRDLPLSFDQEYRKYGFRRVAEATSHVIDNEQEYYFGVGNSTKHDPMKEL
ncbi:MAG: type I-E CRISPR-associated protein Cas5/CasD [Desulfitobacteriia bacterium]|jgi:CRISPR system Cascade subunit CasD